MLITLILHQEA